MMHLWLPPRLTVVLIKFIINAGALRDQMNYKGLGMFFAGLSR